MGALRRLGALYRDAFGGLPQLTWLLCLAAFLNRSGAMVVPFLGIYLGERFGYDLAESGRVLTLYGIGSIVGSLLGGRLADRVGPVRSQVATLSATGVWMLLMTQATHPWTLAGGAFVLGALNDAFRPGNQSAVAQSCPPALRRRALALNRLALNAGWAIGPTVGGYLADIDFRWMFVADGATCALAAAFLWCCLRDWRPVLEPRPASGHVPWVRDRHFVLLMLFTLLYLMAFMQYFSNGSRHLERAFATSKSEIGWLLAINPILIVLFELPAVQAMRSLRALPVIALGSLVTGLGYLLLLPPGLATSGFGLAMVVIAVGEILQMPLLGAYLNDHAPPHARGVYNGVYSGTFALGMVLAPWLGGELYERIGPDALWLTCAGLGTVAGLGFWWMHVESAAGDGPRPGR
jgi:predicted MFS family arabinose efflux permease